MIVSWTKWDRACNVTGALVAHKSQTLHAVFIILLGSQSLWGGSVVEGEVEVFAWSKGIRVVLWWGWEIGQDQELSELHQSYKN